jgi:hypothetical protein
MSGANFCLARFGSAPRNGAILFWLSVSGAKALGVSTHVVPNQHEWRKNCLARCRCGVRNYYKAVLFVAPGRVFPLSR